MMKRIFLYLLLLVLPLQAFSDFEDDLEKLRSMAKQYAEESRDYLNLFENGDPNTVQIIQEVIRYVELGQLSIQSNDKLSTSENALKLQKDILLIRSSSYDVYADLLDTIQRDISSGRSISDFKEVFKDLTQSIFLVSKRSYFDLGQALKLEYKRRMRPLNGMANPEVPFSSPVAYTLETTNISRTLEQHYAFEKPLNLETFLDLRKRVPSLAQDSWFLNFQFRIFDTSTNLYNFAASTFETYFLEGKPFLPSESSIVVWNEFSRAVGKSEGLQEQIDELKERIKECSKSSEKIQIERLKSLERLKQEADQRSKQAIEGDIKKAAQTCLDHFLKLIPKPQKNQKASTQPGSGKNKGKRNGQNQSQKQNTRKKTQTQKVVLNNNPNTNDNSDHTALVQTTNQETQQHEPIVQPELKAPEDLPSDIVQADFKQEQNPQPELNEQPNIAQNKTLDFQNEIATSNVKQEIEINAQKTENPQSDPLINSNDIQSNTITTDIIKDEEYWEYINELRRRMKQSSNPEHRLLIQNQIKSLKTTNQTSKNKPATTVEKIAIDGPGARFFERTMGRVGREKVFFPGKVTKNCFFDFLNQLKKAGWRTGIIPTGGSQFDWFIISDTFAIRRHIHLPHDTEMYDYLLKHFIRPAFDEIGLGDLILTD